MRGLIYPGLYFITGDINRKGTASRKIPTYNTIYHSYTAHYIYSTIYLHIYPHIPHSHIRYTPHTLHKPNTYTPHFCHIIHTYWYYCTSIYKFVASTVAVGTYSSLNSCNDSDRCMERGGLLGGELDGMSVLSEQVLG